MRFASITKLFDLWHDTKNGIEFSPEKKYCQSWQHTIQEFSRLISRIIKCDLLTVRDTLSLNEAQ
jgi:hypothetical protein